MDGAIDTIQTARNALLSKLVLPTLIVSVHQSLVDNSMNKNVIDGHTFIVMVDQDLGTNIVKELRQSFFGTYLRNLNKNRKSQVFTMTKQTLNELVSKQCLADRFLL